MPKPCWLSVCTIGVPPSVLVLLAVGWFMGVLAAVRVAVGEGWLRGCCCCAGEVPCPKGVEMLWTAVAAAVAVFGRLEAEEGFVGGWEGVGVAIVEATGSESLLLVRIVRRMFLRMLHSSCFRLILSSAISKPNALLSC